MWGCNIGQLVPADCGDPLCVPCEKQRARERRGKWLPVLKAMRRPRMMTLTVVNGADLAERIETLQRSFRRFLDTRLGPRNWPEFERVAFEYLDDHFDRLVHEGQITEIERISRDSFWAQSIQRFKESIERYHDLEERWPRVRDLIGEGFASLEITWSEKGWHPHRHLCLDGQFFPWPLLVAIWMRATKGDGQIADIRKIDNRYDKSIQEVAKYLSKTWEIPEEKHDEFRAAIRGLKRIWPIGGAKPVEPEHTCPFCEDPACHGHFLCQGEEFERGKVGDTEMMVIKAQDGQYYLFALQAGVGWRSLPLDLITKSFACHSLVIRGP
jgi:hypothetical protein